jgi:uncharacterized spore protein YtfJ
METEIQKLLDSLADLRRKANANAVFGKPVTSEGRTVVPVAEVSYAFEMGIEGESAEEAAESGGGGSGGMNVRPLAVVEVTPESTSVRPIIDEQRLALAGTLLIGWAVFWVAWALSRILSRQE